MAIYESVNKYLKQVDFKSHCSGNVSGSSSRSNVVCHNCGMRRHLQKYCRSKGNGSSGNPPKKSTNDLPEWVANKPVVSDSKDLATAAMNRKNKKYRWRTS